MVKKLEAISNFLRDQKIKNPIWHVKLETQVNVGAYGGERVTADFQGRSKNEFTDGINTWKSFRIPYKASTNPEYTDREMLFDISQKSEGIGTTGWNWVDKVSEFVGFDFDSLVGHKAGLSQKDMDEIIERAKEIPWVTMIRSKGGRGIHIFVFLDPVISTANHTEHGALARAILSYLSAITQFDFKARVDCCGGNMWVWHRDALAIVNSKLEAGIFSSYAELKEQDEHFPFKLIKQGTPLGKVPPNWREHVDVVSGRKRKPREEDSVFNLLTSTTKFIDLDSEHKKLLDYMDTSGQRNWWWDSDNHMMVCHTKDLADAHELLEFKGIFKTLSEGKSVEHNCFAFPLLGGSWIIRRFTRGTPEHKYWDQDSSGWTRCFYNQRPTLSAVIRTHGGIEGSKGDYEFQRASVMAEAMKDLGLEINIPDFIAHRTCWILPKKGQYIVVTIVLEKSDDTIPGWRANKKVWEKVLKFQKTETDLEAPDDSLRCVVQNGVFESWYLQSIKGSWISQPKGNVKDALLARGFKKQTIDIIVGKTIDEPWEIVSFPFQPEYVGDRKWNKNSAQLGYEPQKGECKTWIELLNHLGKLITPHILINEWCINNNVVTGGDYLKCWVASLFQMPTEPLPYLFFYSEARETGKTTFHEALRLLLGAGKGYVRADVALTSTGNFNAELMGAVLCVVEEVNLSQSKLALERVKDLVTSATINIHRKGSTPFSAPNTTHWVQCANDPEYFPIMPGDSRVTVCKVSAIKNKLPRTKLFEKLKAEAPAFLYELLNLEVPDHNGRLRVPIIFTTDKANMEQASQVNPLQDFIDEYMTPCSGGLIPFSDFYIRFIATLNFEEQTHWTKHMVGRSFPKDIAKGKYGTGRQIHVGNYCWKDEEINPGMTWYVSPKNELQKRGELK